MRAALGRAEGGDGAKEQIAGLRSAILEDLVVDEPRALRELLTALDYFDAGLIALLDVHGEASSRLRGLARAWERAR